MRKLYHEGHAEHEVLFNCFPCWSRCLPGESPLRQRALRDGGVALMLEARGLALLGKYCGLLLFRLRITIVGRCSFGLVESGVPQLNRFNLIRGAGLVREDHLTVDLKFVDLSCVCCKCRGP
jgi:hypothetical protein